MLFRRVRWALALALILFAVPAAGGLASPYPRVAHNPADRMTDTPIDGYRYDRATHCVRRPAAGATTMIAWLGRHVRGESWGTNRCERLGDGYSLHADIGLSWAGARMRTSFWRSRR